MLIFFFWDQVFASQIKTMEEFCKVTPTPLRASFKSPISCTKSNTWSAHKDSPVSKTVFSSFFGDQVFASQIKTKEELWRVKPTLCRSAISHPSLVQSQTPDQRIKTVQCPKQFFPLFLGTKSLHHRSRLRKSCEGWNQLFAGQL